MSKQRTGGQLERGSTEHLLLAFLCALKDTGRSGDEIMQALWWVVEQLERRP